MSGLLAQGLNALANADPDAAGVLKPRLDRIVILLDLYMDEIETFNPRYGLVNVENREALVVRHILDSLAPLGHLIRLCAAIVHEDPPAPCYIADIGSGAGFPGIPLAICLPDSEFTLIERMTRRAGFLRDAAAVLGLANVTVEEADMEQAKGGRFDLVVFRALSPLGPALVKSFSRLLVPHGLIAAWKGRRDTAERELAAAGFGMEAGVGTAELIPLSVPFLDEERYLVIMRNH